MCGSGGELTWARACSTAARRFFCCAAKTLGDWGAVGGGDARSGCGDGAELFRGGAELFAACVSAELTGETPSSLSGCVERVTPVCRAQKRAVSRSGLHVWCGICGSDRGYQPPPQVSLSPADCRKGVGWEVRQASARPLHHPMSLCDGVGAVPIPHAGSHQPTSRASVWPAACVSRRR